GLHVDPYVTGVHGDGERLGGRQAGVEGAVDEQAPDVAEGDLAHQILDVDAPVPESAALLVRFGDLRFERDDSFEPGYEVGHQAAPRDVGDGWAGCACVVGGEGSLGLTGLEVLVGEVGWVGAGRPGGGGRRLGGASGGSTARAAGGVGGRDGTRVSAG